MQKICLGVVGSLVLASVVHAQPSASPRTLLEGYCVTCHNERAQQGGLVLTPADADHPERRPELWEKVIRKLSSDTMPPNGARRPDQAQIAEAVASLEAALDRAATEAPDPGRVVLHRLNRAEYVNAIRDLLALEVNAVDTLPADDSGYGFDNIADVLTVSSALFERYLSAARRIARDAVGDHTSILPVMTTLAKIPMFRVQSDRMGEGLPFGSRGGIAVRHYFPVDGEYILRIDFHRGAMSGVIRGLQDDAEVDVRVDGKRVKLFHIEKMERSNGNYSEGTGQEALELRLSMSAGPHTIAVALRKVTTTYEGWGPTTMPVASNSFAATDRMTNESGRVEVSVESLILEGPFSARPPSRTPSRDLIFTCRPSAPGDERCATQILSRLAYRAYHRPVPKEDVATLLEFYRAGRDQEPSDTEQAFERGIQFALERILIDPDFLFRAERPISADADEPVQLIDQFALASRLSFFLWSSIPDEPLLEAAVRGTLREPTVLEGQVTRMLADPRAGALVQNFFGQWLMLRNMKALTPDQTVYPAFDDNLRHDLRRETELFIDSQLQEDRGVTELLTADYTYLNERLARHYGVPGVYGSHFRRITMTDPNRRGLLGHGSILAVTSYANRTSPVLRGKWLLQNILGTPPPPPPANVPPLEDTVVSGTLRQRMERHRQNPVCSSCHLQLDPPGFALENFDAIGAWRSTDAGQPIDASGALPDGTTFSGPESFRAALLSRQDQFVATVTERLLTYALGRGVEYYDMPAVRAIVRDAAASNYRWSSLILGVVESVPFQMRGAS